MGSEKRQFRREKHRMGCQFKVDDRVHNGIVSDISARGLFVHSTTRPTPGTEIEILLRDPRIGEIVVRCRVTRLLRSHRSAAVVIPSGFGAEIDYAPEEFFDLLVEMGLG